jgi:hypothetical protein
MNKTTMDTLGAERMKRLGLDKENIAQTSGAVDRRGSPSGREPVREYFEVLAKLLDGVAGGLFDVHGQRDGRLDDARALVQAVLDRETVASRTCSADELVHLLPNSRLWFVGAYQGSTRGIGIYMLTDGSVKTTAEIDVSVAFDEKRNALYIAEAWLREGMRPMGSGDC